MLKEILGFKGVVTLNKKEQSTIQGGNTLLPFDGDIDGDGGIDIIGVSDTGFCIENGKKVVVPCHGYCLNGTAPICGY